MKKKLICCACDKNQNETEILIVLNKKIGTCLCNECVDICTKILIEQRQKERATKET